MALFQNYWSLMRAAYDGGSLKILPKGVVYFQKRTRITIAQANAGVTLIPAPGLDYALRLVNYKVIAVGGNAGAATALLIRGTQGGSGVSLVSIALAALTRSAVNTPTVANNTVLADGASFVNNDENTAITAIKSGSDFTTATHFDIDLVYAVAEV